METDEAVRYGNNTFLYALLIELLQPFSLQYFPSLRSSVPHIYEGRGLCQASSTALQQSSTEERPHADYEVTKLRLEQLFPPPPSSTQPSQTPEAPHHLRLGSISVQTQGQSFTSLLRTQKE